MLDLLVPADPSQVTRVALLLSYMNTSIFVLGHVATLVGLAMTYQAIRNSMLSQVFTGIVSHDVSIYGDPYKQEAAGIFLGLSHRPPVRAEELDRDRLYWAARSIHVYHLNLLAQLWGMAGGRERLFRRRFPGWVPMAEALVRELAHPASGQKPDWYMAACRDLWPIDDLGYGRTYLAWMNRMAAKPDASDRPRPGVPGLRATAQ